MTHPEPVASQLHDRVRERCRALLERLELELGRAMPRPEVRFDLRGRAAGQAALDGTFLRFNAVLLQDQPQAFLEEVVPHEIAHVAVGVIAPRARPHGREWRAVMRLLGVEPRRCHDFDTRRSETRRLRRFEYRCDCDTHALTSIRHNRVLAGTVYRCRRCGAPLRRIEPGRDQRSTR